MAPEAVPTRSAPATDKRELAAPTGESSSPQKTPKISSIRFGIGSADKIGEVTAREHEEQAATLSEATAYHGALASRNDC